MTDTSDEYTLDQWNHAELWVSAYAELAAGCYFFAEDLFGNQFALSEMGVLSFEAETGETEMVGATIEEWAMNLIEECDLMTGLPLADAWQEKNGILPCRSRLVPKVPFVVGGGFELENLYLSESVAAMKFRASLALQMRDLPDGSLIRLVISD